MFMGIFPFKPGECGDQRSAIYGGMALNGFECAWLTYGLQ